MKDHNAHFNGNHDYAAAGETTENSKTVMIIAAAPFHSSRARSIWSQLECFTDHIDKVVIAAADFTQTYFDLFIQEAIEAMPHLKNIDIEIKYYKNDRYDVGLWCDALHDSSMSSIGSAVVDSYDHFVLINDSIHAIQHSSELIDVTRSRNLNMASLTYSELGGAKSNTHNGEYWLEANYRSFDAFGIKTLMNHVCKPIPCSAKKAKKRLHRCMVDTLEIPVASWFNRTKTWGLYLGDVPIEYFDPKVKTRFLQTR